jgi:hypothetical protein
VHEQYPQALGCDRRLLALVRLMKLQGSNVSLLYRRQVPRSEQSPPTPELAKMLMAGRASAGLAELDGACLTEPPALYPFSGRGAQLARLARSGWFDMVLITVWFWNDPSPAFAELALPYFRAHGPTHRQPYVALLVDDAHALRASRLAHWETDKDAKLAYESQAASLLPRLHALYSQAHAVLHVSSADQLEERRQFSSLGALHWGLLRTPLGAMRATTPRHRRAGPSKQPLPEFPPTSFVGFLGNGQTATNHQGVEWFLSHCWPQLRAASPSLRLRLVGRLPGTISNSTGLHACERRVGGTRCGWAWGTPYAGREAEHGIDELGYLPAREMLAELRSWRAMVAPIRVTTGINTKLLVALELGLPLVVTRAAALPLGLLPQGNASAAGSRAAALFADDVLEFTSATLQLVGSEVLWRRMSRASRDTFEQMESVDPAAEDMKGLLHSACDARERADLQVLVPRATRPLELWQHSAGTSIISLSSSLCDVLDSPAACADRAS